MSIVWRGLDRELEREVAVKTLELAGGAPAGAPERFRREARTLAALSHPNIVTIFDTGVDDNTVFLVMELLPGPTLAQQLAGSGALPVADVVTVSRQVCAALSAAHAAGVIHRDIKPANIAYAADGTVKVLDFGITRILDEITGSHTVTVTAAGTVLGTPAYLSPEQAADAPVDGRADLYALGCVMTALLTGAPPFTGTSAMALIMKQMHEIPAPVSEQRPDVPGLLASLVARLLAKDPADRPASASEVGALLDDIASSDVDTVGATVPLPLATRVLPPPERVFPLAARPRRRLWWVAGIVALAMLVLAVGGILALRPDGAGRPAAQTPRTTHTQAGSPSSTPAGSGVSSRDTAGSTQPPPASAGTTSPAAGTPAAAINALRAAVSTAVTNGDLDAKAAGDINHRLDDLSHALAAPQKPGKPPKHGKPGKPPKHGASEDLAKKVDDLVTYLDALTASGQLTSQGRSLLASPLATLQRLLPSGQ